MTTLRFKIGEAFPASDPVARFVTVLAMMSNDWLRLTTQLLDTKPFFFDAEGLVIMSFRHQAALHHEAAEFIRDTRKRFPDVEQFVTALPQAARDDLQRVLDGVDPKSPVYHGDWLDANRNVTFHYPEMHLQKAAHGKEEIFNALTEAAGLEGTITTEENFGSVRFGFADEVAVQWIPEHDTAATVANLRDAVAALAQFVQRAALAYLGSRPEGTFDVE
jgi:hypothetical protein